MSSRYIYHDHSDLGIKKDITTIYNSLHLQIHTKSETVHWLTQT